MLFGTVLDDDVERGPHMAALAACHGETLASCRTRANAVGAHRVSQSLRFFREPETFGTAAERHAGAAARRKLNFVA